MQTLPIGIIASYYATGVSFWDCGGYLPVLQESAFDG